MQISISNIAWELQEEEAIARDIVAAGVTNVDIAPGKYIPDPEGATPDEIEVVRSMWAARGFHIIGMQALLFGTTNLNLFTDDGTMLRRLSALCRIGGGLGARALTFGSPRQRDRSGLSDADAMRIAVDFFRRLGDVASREGVVVCLEPNPVVYGCNFMVTTAEAASIVDAVDHPGIRLQIDVGAMALNDEPVAKTIARYAALAGHVHASEPMLATLGDGSSRHEEAAIALSKARPDLVVTVEMAASKTEPHGSAVRRAVALAQRIYGDAA